MRGPREALATSQEACQYIDGPSPPSGDLGGPEISLVLSLVIDIVLPKLLLSRLTVRTLLPCNQFSANLQPNSATPHSIYQVPMT